MATVSITIPDALVPRITAAMRVLYPQHTALTDVQAFKAITGEYWKAILANYESNVAETTARTKANSDTFTIG